MQTLHTFAHGNTAEVPPETNGTMGAIMEKITISDVAETYGRKADTLYRKAKDIWPERKWSIFSEVTEEEGRVLLGDLPAPASGKKRRKAPVRKIRESPALDVSADKKPAEAAAGSSESDQADGESLSHAVVRVCADALAICIVLGHGGLLWYDCAVIWLRPGIISGGIVLAVVCLALLLAAQSNLPRTSRAALILVGAIDIGAWFVHFEVFRTPVVSDTITGWLCAFICLMSFFALYLYRDSKLD